MPLVAASLEATNAGGSSLFPFALKDPFWCATQYNALRYVYGVAPVTEWSRRCNRSSQFKACGEGDSGCIVVLLPHSHLDSYIARTKRHSTQDKATHGNSHPVVHPAVSVAALTLGIFAEQRLASRDKRRWERKPDVFKACYSDFLEICHPQSVCRETAKHRDVKKGCLSL